MCFRNRCTKNANIYINACIYSGKLNCKNHNPWSPKRVSQFNIEIYSRHFKNLFKEYNGTICEIIMQACSEKVNSTYVNCYNCDCRANIGASGEVQGQHSNIYRKNVFLKNFNATICEIITSK